jgi:hypothetical protein
MPTQTHSISIQNKNHRDKADDYANSTRQSVSQSKIKKQSNTAVAKPADVLASYFKFILNYFDTGTYLGPGTGGKSCHCFVLVSSTKLRAVGPLHCGPYCPVTT